MSVKSFVVQNYGVSCLTFISDKSNLKMKIQQAKNRFKFARYDDSYSVTLGKSRKICGLVVKASLEVSGDMV